MRLLHLGAGNRPPSVDFQPSEITSNDLAPLPHIDWCYDLNILPWPIPDCSYDYIYAHDILEHLDKTHLIIDEMIRVCSTGGVLDIQVPMAGSLAHVTDVTHMRGFAENSFGHFIRNHPYCKGQPYFSSHRLDLISATLDNNYTLEVTESGFINPLPPNVRLSILTHQVIGNLRFKLCVVR